ncbi:hypothetical protein ACIBCO_39130 [Streptomyces violascens]|uniref:hypothetical protein n=1 Tax=Streptomyces violascens TaxID=67381 RepID=UPI0037A8583A
MARRAVRESLQEPHHVPRLDQSEQLQARHVAVIAQGRASRLSTPGQLRRTT